MGSDPREKVYSVWGWLGTMLLMCIPIVGTFILPFVWAFSSKTNKSKKNFFIVYIIMLVIGIILAIVLSATIGAMLDGIFNGVDFGSDFYFPME